ncbi:N-acetylmuramoyl-L-alanine amidase [Pseudalkalibacillus salsuginis]|uniref:N-acetylmuramoyl-L-alanine amidase n=1 Tax=Pseudalkalibacillus salsuginis TaxID=2910972 RepID=UPI001F27F27B|nr:N-acetylmuramoyl-L-alanine amidase [Pseudalkalibacillus salsuginis]MCF6410093.1 N-acetylmuramoyl-L-alanine amidase [Pseudalkalibacillus salsuginis]
MKKFVGFMLVFVVFVATLMSGSPGMVSANSSFKDISSSYPYKEQINYLVNKEIINGYPDNTFRPDEKVTRREAAVMVSRAKGLSGTKRSTSFSDVSSKDYASGYIQSAFEAGYINGYSDGTYRPDATMSRVEMAYLLSQVFGFNTYDKYYYSDVNPFTKSYHPINKITAHGISEGYPDNTFKPTKDMNRTEFAIFVARSLEPTYRVTKKENTVLERVVTADVLNVRKGPGTSYSKVGSLTRGTQTYVQFTANDWAYVKTSSTQGYVHQAYIAKPVSAISGSIITIDPGHGGKDPGAIANGLVEKEINLAVSKKLQKHLEAAGAKVVMTRTDNDTYPSLSDRVKIAENSNSTVFVSIHANKFSDKAAHGTETYYNYTAPQGEEGKKLATFIQNRLYKAIDTYNRGVKHGNFHVIRENTIPGVLVELGFMTNPEDAKKLASNTYRELMAKAIYQGIVDYYNSKK